MDKEESTINAGASATETLTATGRESVTLLCLKCKHYFKSYEPLVVFCTNGSPSMLLHLLPSGASFPVFYLLIQGFHEEVHDFFQVDVECLWVNGLPFEGRDQGYLFLWDIFHLNTTHLLHAHIREVQFAAQRTELPDSLSLYHLVNSLPLRKVKRLAKYQRSQRRGDLGPPSTSAHWSA